MRHHRNDLGFLNSRFGTKAWFKSTRPDQLFYKQQLTSTRIVVECLVADQALAGSNPFDPITLLSLNSCDAAFFYRNFNFIFVDNTDNITTSGVFAWKSEPLLRANH